MIEHTEIGNEVIEIARNAMNRQDGKKEGQEGKAYVTGASRMCHGSVTGLSWRPLPAQKLSLVIFC